MLSRRELLEAIVISPILKLRKERQENTQLCGLSIGAHYFYRKRWDVVRRYYAELKKRYPNLSITRLHAMIMNRIGKNALTVYVFKNAGKYPILHITSKDGRFSNGFVPPFPEKIDWKNFSIT